MIEVILSQIFYIVGREFLIHLFHEDSTFLKILSTIPPLPPPSALFDLLMSGLGTLVRQGLAVYFIQEGSRSLGSNT